MKETPEQRAEARYPEPKPLPDDESRGELIDHWNESGLNEGYATCIREEVEPLEAEVERLRALVQVLGNAFVQADNGDVEQDGTKQASGHAHRIHAIWDMDNGPAKAGKPCLKCLAFDAARLALKQQGFVPTNTEDHG